MMQPPAPPNLSDDTMETAMRTVVLIGASIRSAAQSAKRAGFHVIGIDHFGDIDTREACAEFWILREFLADAHARQRFENLPIFMVGGLKHTKPLTEFLTHAPPRRDLTSDWTGNVSTAATDVFFAKRGLNECWEDPRWLRELSLECGLKFPTTLNAFEAAASGVKPTEKGWLVKTRHSCGGLGVRWYQSETILNAKSPEAVSVSTLTNENSQNQGIEKIHGMTQAEPVILQRWVPGRTYGATLLSNGGDCRLLGLCRSLFTRMGNLPFVYRGSFGPVAIGADLKHRLENLGHRLIQETSHRGLLNIDLVINQQDEVHVLEVNPRWSGSSELIDRWMRAKETTCSLFSSMIQACQGFPLDRLPSCRESTGLTPQTTSPIYLKQILFARRDMRFTQDLLMSGEENSMNSCYRPALADIPAEGTTITRGNPICTVLAELTSDVPDKSSRTNHEKSPMQQHRAFLNRLHARARN